MLAKLPHGLCVDPEIVKLFHVKLDRVGTSTPTYSVCVRTEADDNFLAIANFEDRDKAVELARECAKLVNEAAE